MSKYKETDQHQPEKFNPESKKGRDQRGAKKGASKNSNLTHQERLLLADDNPDKLHKGVFIAKLRQKQGDAGRIKAEGFTCKINVRFNNGALHESNVYWRQVSRRAAKKAGKSDKSKDAPMQGKGNKEGKQGVKTLHYKEKVAIQSPSQVTNDGQTSRSQTRGPNQSEIPDKGQDEQNQNQKEETESLTDPEQGQYTINAKIVRILNCPHQKRSIVCTVLLQRNKYRPSEGKDTLDSLEDDYYVDAIPVNPRIEKFVVRTLEPMRKSVEHQSKTLTLKFFDQHYFAVRYADWPTQDKLPTAKLERMVSLGFTPEGQCEALLQELGLVGYDQSKVKKDIPLQITPQHKDYKDLFVFTIDPETSVDLDDALSIQKVGDQFQVGIHIADVTSYLHLIDREKLCKLATSAYLPYTAKHMLPDYMVKIITLGPNVDRLAFSVFTRLNSKGQAKDVRFQKTIIHSKCKLAYQHAQRVIDGKKPDFPEYLSQADSATVKQKILLLNQLAQTRRKQRTLLDLFNNQEIKFQLDENNFPINISKKERFEANKLVEEFMLLGNQLVAKRLVQGFPKDAIIIHHPVPSKTNRDFFNKMFEEYGFQLKFTSMKELESNIMDFFEKSDNKLIQELVKMKATRIHELARYQRISDSSQGHFALGMGSYTHFTSPMRRFADIIAAQMLIKCLNSKQPMELGPQERAKMDSEIQITNGKRQASKRLKSQITQKFLALAIHHKKAYIQTEAIVVSFGVNSGTILVPDYDMQKQIYWKTDLYLDRVKQSDSDTLSLSFTNANKPMTWQLKKHQKIKIRMDCKKYLPLELAFHVTATINNKEYMIRAYDY